MVFSSLIFLCIFLPIFFISYYLVKGRKARNVVLLLFSLVFYAWGEPIYVFLMIGSIFMNFFFALKMEEYKEISDKKDNRHRYAEQKHARKMKKTMLVISIIFNLLLLGVFKYTDFTIGNLNTWFGLELEFTNIALPIGISFFTFQILSYVIDVYRGKVAVQHSVIDLGAYVSAFPQLIAGPIVRYETIEKELSERCETVDDAADGIRQFIVGISKKALIANTCGEIITILEQYSNVQYKMIGALIIALAYTFQIYFDFSGYSDMAIGLGKMMGFHYDKNFNYPYIARSVTDFWRRWHISLSTFFRDYLYIPLGGNRVKWWRHILNLLIVWFLTGLWHGASWNFVLWGLYYGVILIIEKYAPNWIKKIIPRFIGHILTIVAFVFGWVIFRIETLDAFNEFMKTIFGGYGIGNYEFLVHIGLITPQYITTAILAILGSTPLGYWIYSKLKKYTWCKVTFDVILTIMFVVSFIFVAVSQYNPFIYFKF